VPQALRRVLHSGIADRLIEKHKTGSEDLGLEIAWHCIRAGRSTEASSYLLEGARNAILSGAPYEAERGLSTALPQLAGPDRTEALILLSEALQEQSRWMESLLHIEQIESTSDPRVSQAAFVLTTKAQRRLGLIDIKELSRLPARLLGFMRSRPDPLNTIRAAVEAASIIESIRCNSLAPDILECLSSIDPEQLGLDDSAHLLLAKSMLHYQMKNLSASLECARQSIELLEKHNHPNSVLAMLQNGIGAILAKQGLYAESVPEYMKCYHTSSRVGNDRIYAQASGNLSLSFMRLGEYQNAITWGERSLSDSSALTNLGFGFQAAEGTVFSYAITKTNLVRAEELISRVWAQLADAPLGLSQAWSLYSADAYALMGRARVANEEGRRGTEGINNELRMDFYAGPYARWIARTCLSDADCTRARHKLHSLLMRLEAYDAQDQAEILNAKCWLDGHNGGAAAEEIDLMWKHLTALPRAVTEQLRLMGMLDFC
jgi:tetratricopeptide (TPR) repeat protein